MSSRGRIEALVDECRGRVLAALVANLGNLDTAEDALQDALVRALERWPEEGLPANPAGWLYRTARHRAIDAIRRDRGHAEKIPALTLHFEQLHDDDEPDEASGDIPDERLRLIFTCCHPALASEARVALTLKTLGRLSTPEIARAFLTPEPTMAQRLVRAKRKIASAGIPWRVPEGDDLPERLASVLAVIYLIFNEGYSAASGAAAVRGDLCDEAIRLARIVATLAPQAGEASSLLALLVVQDSRRLARQDERGDLVPLEHQDRHRWDVARIREGEAALAAARAVDEPPGPYRLQAEIAMEHARAPSFAATDWRRVAEGYDRLYRLRPDPVIRINGAVALSYAHSPGVGLTALEPLADDPAAQRYLPYHAARADILRRLGRPAAAAEAYRAALALPGNDEQRRFLEGRLAQVESVAAGPVPDDIAPGDTGADDIESGDIESGGSSPAAAC